MKLEDLKGKTITVAKEIKKDNRVVGVQIGFSDGSMLSVKVKSSPLGNDWSSWVLFNLNDVTVSNILV